jgi:enoyl-CoA hydratase
MSQKFILKEVQDRVMVITLNRPEALNALNKGLVCQLNQALKEAEEDINVGAIVIMGNEKAFAAGADIREMQDPSFAQSYGQDFVAVWDNIRKIRKPIIAAVSGYALGGGCELAMMCDIILASEGAQFGQPEIALGTIPGFGGTQRLPRLIGKTKAMEMCLSGRMMGAKEAEACGLVTRVVPAAQLHQEALSLAHKIASFSMPVVKMVKEAICASQTLSLEEGLRLEQRLFQATFALKDRQEGMAAFLEKRKPDFNKS